MKIYKILSGIMTSVVMVASLSASELVEPVVNSPELVPVKTLAGKVWDKMPSMSFVKALPGKALGCVPSRDSVKNFAGKVWNKMPSMSFVKALPGKAVKLAAKAVKLAVVHPKSSVAILLGTAAVAGGLVYKKRAFKKKREAGLKAGLPPTIKGTKFGVKGLQVSCYFASYTKLEVQGIIVESSYESGLCYEFGFEKNQGGMWIRESFYGKVVWISQESLDRLTQDKPLVLAALRASEVAVPRMVTNT